MFLQNQIFNFLAIVFVQMYVKIIYSGFKCLQIGGYFIWLSSYEFSSMRYIFVLAMMEFESQKYFKIQTILYVIQKVKKTTMIMELFLSKFQQFMNSLSA